MPHLDVEYLPPVPAERLPSRLWYFVAGILAALAAADIVAALCVLKSWGAAMPGGLILLGLVRVHAITFFRRRRHARRCRPIVD
jgi:hypothetical protein